MRNYLTKKVKINSYDAQTKTGIITCRDLECYRTIGVTHMTSPNIGVENHHQRHRIIATTVVISCSSLSLVLRARYMHTIYQTRGKDIRTKVPYVFLRITNNFCLLKKTAKLRILVIYILCFSSLYGPYNLINLYYTFNAFIFYTNVFFFSSLFCVPKCAPY